MNKYLHSFVIKNEKSIIETTVQYIKERSERFDGYFPCIRTSMI
jgi:hypothetical protein